MMTGHGVCELGLDDNVSELFRGTFKIFSVGSCAHFISHSAAGADFWRGPWASLEIQGSMYS